MSNESPFTKPDYEENQEARKDRFEARAEKANNGSDQAFNESKELVDCIPFGQPILVGHHSEAGHRRRLERSNNKMRKSVELDRKAKHYGNRAASVGSGGIASDDPAALVKLKSKLDNLVESQEIMKAANKEFKSGGWEGIKSLNSDMVAKLRETQPSYEKRPFASYSLSNNNANINRIKKRIAELETLRNTDASQFEVTNDDFNIYIDEGRVCILFHEGKPNGEARRIVKSNGFKWSRYRSEWVRKATANALYSAKLVSTQLLDTCSIYD